MSAHLAVCASGSGLFLFIYLLEELSQTLFLSPGQKRCVPPATHQLLGGGGGYQEKTEYPKQISVPRSTPAGFTRVSLLNWKMNILLA